jgi:ribosome-associated toxin RatA of RatAB toxin-antitoxin module
LALISSTRKISLAPAQVFATARQVTRFPDVLPNLDKVELLEDQGNGVVVTNWEASFTIGPLSKTVKWKEIDTWRAEDLTCTFELVEGDMKVYRGTWDFKPQGDGCLVELNVDFELGITMLGPMIDKIVNQLMQQNCDDLLMALDKLAAEEEVTQPAD